METYVIFYNINSLIAPTKVRSKWFTSLQRAQSYYNICRADWYGKALKEYEETTNNENYRPKFDEFFKESVNPSKDVLSEFGGEIGWTRYRFSLEKV